MKYFLFLFDSLSMWRYSGKVVWSSSGCNSSFVLFVLMKSFSEGIFYMVLFSEGGIIDEKFLEILCRSFPLLKTVAIFIFLLFNNWMVILIITQFIIS